MGKTCARSCPVAELANRNEAIQRNLLLDNALTQLKDASSQKVEILLRDKEFQNMVSKLQSPQLQLSEEGKTKGCPATLDPFRHLPVPFPMTEMAADKPSFYIFVSFSLSEKALLNLAFDAQQFGATLVLRGFKAGSHRKTAQALNTIITKTGQGVIIDPELFSLFHITAVPSFVLTKPFQLHAQERSQTPMFDKLQGHVSASYALETFAQTGDLKEEAQKILSQKSLQTGVSP